MELINDTLFVIPARKGSKGLPGKNIRKLNGKPLFLYTVDAARGVCRDENICISTNDDDIIQIVESYGLKVPFKRPEELAADNSDSWSVVNHAIQFYKGLGKTFSKICLLQPTSPLRTSRHIQECYNLWDENTEMIVSVKKSKRVSSICNENKAGFLNLTINKEAKQRQEFADFYEYNGAVYLLDSKSYASKEVKNFTKIRKYLMKDSESVDIDNELDFKLCEFILNKKSNSD